MVPTTANSSIRRLMRSRASGSSPRTKRIRSFSMTAARVFGEAIGHQASPTPETPSSVSMKTRTCCLSFHFWRLLRILPS